MNGLVTIKKKRKGRGDLPLLFSVIIISLLGLAFVYSASKYSAEVTYGDEFFFAKKHLVGLLIGYAAMIFGCAFDYEKYKKISLPSFIVTLVLLVLVFSPLGYENYGAKRWIRIAGITVQPSEIAKICFVLFSAAYFSDEPRRAKSFIGCLPVLCAGGTVCLLIILEPNMSITVCFGLLTLAVLFAAGMKTAHFVIILVPAALGRLVRRGVSQFAAKTQVSSFFRKRFYPRGNRRRNGFCRACGVLRSHFVCYYSRNKNRR